MVPSTYAGRSYRAEIRSRCTSRPLLGSARWQVAPDGGRGGTRAAGDRGGCIGGVFRLQQHGEPTRIEATRGVGMVVVGGTRSLPTRMRSPRTGRSAAHWESNELVSTGITLMAVSSPAWSLDGVDLRARTRTGTSSSARPVLGELRRSTSRGPGRGRHPRAWELTMPTGQRRDR